MYVSMYVRMYVCMYERQNFEELFMTSFYLFSKNLLRESPRRSASLYLVLLEMSDLGLKNWLSV